jgi:PEP-CTERM motif
MVKRLGLFCACLLVAGPVSAATMVTWVGEGEVWRSYSTFPGLFGPPVGTPVSITLSFDPAQQGPTPLSPLGSDCMMVPASASASLGGYTFNAPNALGFTNAQLIGTNCAPGTGETQFSLYPLQGPPGSPWPLEGNGVLVLSYFDLISPDLFPDAPTALGASLWYQGFVGFGFDATLDLRAVDLQPAPIPEPGSVTLFGLGLAAITRHVRRRRMRGTGSS